MDICRACCHERDGAELSPLNTEAPGVEVPFPFLDRLLLDEIEVRAGADGAIDSNCGPFSVLSSGAIMKRNPTGVDSIVAVAGAVLVSCVSVVRGTRLVVTECLGSMRYSRYMIVSSTQYSNVQGLPDCDP